MITPKNNSQFWVFAILRAFDKHSLTMVESKFAHKMCHTGGTKTEPDFASNENLP